MKKGVFLLYKPINLKNPSGIEKKILKQCDCFSSAGIDVIPKVVANFPKMQDAEIVEISQYDFIYFRRQHTISYPFVRSLGKIKRYNPKCLIYMDIPTYPYQGEYGKGLRGLIALRIDSFFCHFLYNVVDKVILTGTQNIKAFYNIKAINIYNGIETNGLPVFQDESEDDVIRIGCFGKYSKWHGYERIITGLHNYYQNRGSRQIQLLFAGDGPELMFYKKLTSEYGLEKNVCFLGFLSEPELKIILQKLDFGCCSLGRYKSNLDVIGDLKSREYLSHGIPLITGCKIDILEPIDFLYRVKFDNNSTPIEMERIVKFYDARLKGRKSIVRAEIYNKVASIININNTFTPVLTEVKDDLKI